jgi:hypothetical protein
VKNDGFNCSSPAENDLPDSWGCIKPIGNDQEKFYSVAYYPYSEADESAGEPSGLIFQVSNQ